MTREEAIYTLRVLFIPCASGGNKWGCDRNKAIDMAIEALQTDVVRCKDCRHAEDREQMPNQIYCKRDKLSTFCAVHDDDDFCKYGERKGGDDE